MNEHVDQEHQRERGPDSLNPRIWIASLADYNAGRLHGDWIDAAVDEQELLAAAQRILASSREPGAEEWGIFDFDEFGAFRVNEYDDLAMVAKVARGIAEHGPAYAAWAELHGGDPTMLDQFEDCFLGAYDSEVDWAREGLDDAALDYELERSVADSLRPYVSIDYAALARDSQLGGDIYIERTPTGGVWIFRTY